jgi:hypothetical protein
MSWTVFATMMFISSDLICTIKNERLGSIATVLLFAFAPTNVEDQTLERGPLNLGTVATIPWIWTPLSRPIKIRWLRSSVCYSTVNLLQYFCISAVNGICYSAVYFGRSQPHDEERTAWIDRYSDPLYICPHKCRGSGHQLERFDRDSLGRGLGPLNLGTVTTVP